MPIFLSMDELREFGGANEVENNNLVGTEFEDAKVVYRFKEDGESATLYDFYYEDENYLDNDIVIPLSKIVKRIEFWSNGCAFRNVEGSSKDKRKSWIKFYEKIILDGKTVTKSYENQNIYPDSSDGKEKKDSCNSQYDKKTKKRKNIVGGHVYTGKKEQKKPKDIAIVPICKHHNVHCEKENAPGLGFYMTLNDSCKVPIIEYKLSENIINLVLAKLNSDQTKKFEKE